MDNVLEDAETLQQMFHPLLTNQSGASAWISHILESVTEIIIKVCYNFLHVTMPLTSRILLQVDL